jgi:hypothetical protein
MGGKSKAPPPPDYTPIAAASAESARVSADVAREQLAWAREQYYSDKAITDLVVATALDQQATNDAAAAKDRARYEQKYQPLEDELISDAKSYATKERQDLEAGKATAAVGEQFNQARQAALQNLESYGVDPTSTRYAALDLGTRVQQAAAQAAAGNNARTQTEAMGRAMRSEAINVGRGYPGQIAGTYGTSLQAGNQAANTTLAQTASGANTMGTGMQWQGMGNQALGIWGNTLNMGYQNQMAQYNANQQSSSGLGSALGMGLGLLTTPLKGTMLGMLADGGTVPGEGGQVPPEASPTRGQAIDDVPARLTPGEFVIPKDVVSWVGERTMHQMIEKAKKEQSELPQRSGAIPDVVPMTAPERPTFASRGGAI